MGSQTRAYVLGILVLIAWLPYAKALFSYPSGAVDQITYKVQQMPVEVRSTIQDQYGGIQQYITETANKMVYSWAEELALFVLGLTAGMMTIFRLPFWRTVVVLMSCIFIFFYIRNVANLPITEHSIIALIKWKLSFASSVQRVAGLAGYLGFIYKELVLLCLHSFFIVFIPAKFILDSRINRRIQTKE